MKTKILVLLLLAFSSVSIAQTTLASKLKITGNTTSSTATKVNVQESNGEINTMPIADLAKVAPYASAINLPAIGEDGKIYITKDNNKLYRWTGVIYQELADNVTNTYVTPEQYGALGDGVNDDRSAIQNALNSGKIVFFTKNYHVSGTITISQKTQLLGNGKLIVDGDYPAIDIKSNDVVIDGLRFEGNGRGTSTDYVTTRPLQSGIKILGATDLSINYKNIQISNCSFYNLGGKAIDISYNYSTQYNGGALISNSFADTCFIGFYVGDRAEYSSFVNCKATNCEVGFNSLGGNNPLTGCNLDNNRTGVFLETGQNPGHSTITGGSINHSKSRAVWSNGEDGGYVFNGVEILVNGNIYIQNSDKIQFLNCDIIASTIDVISSSNTRFHNCKFDTTPTFTGLNAIEFFNTKWIGTPPIGFYDYLNNGIKLSNVPDTMAGSSDLLVRQISDGSLKKLGYVPYNPATYPINSGGENISSVTARSGSNSSNIGINGAALSAGGASGWLTVNGTSTYSGGLIASLSGNPKAYYYVSGSYALIEGASGVGVKLISSGSDALVAEPSGIVKIPNLAGTGDSAIGTDSAGNLKRIATTTTESGSWTPAAIVGTIFSKSYYVKTGNVLTFTVNGTVTCSNCQSQSASISLPNSYTIKNRVQNTLVASAPMIVSSSPSAATYGFVRYYEGSTDSKFGITYNFYSSLEYSFSITGSVEVN